MRAIAMRILFLRKMSSKMMMTSTMARIITKENGREKRHKNQMENSVTAIYTGILVVLSISLCLQ